MRKIKIARSISLIRRWVKIIRTVSRLDFDSNISGFEIGKFDLIKTSSQSYNKVFTDFKLFDLIYLTSGFNLLTSNILSGFDWTLADVRITLTNNLENLGLQRRELTFNDFYQNNDYNKVLNLAKDLYKVSRFYYDVNTRNLGKLIYSEWIINSINKSIADEIIVHRDEQGAVIGFITVKEANFYTEPVLVKVEEKYTGKGYGKIIMNKFFNFVAQSRPQKEIKIKTQLSNKTALNFYHTLGFKINEIKFIYHVYPNGFKRI